MRPTEHLVVSLLAVLAVGWWGGEARADTPPRQATLAKLSGVYLLVESSSIYAEADGLNRASLQAKVERQLRSGGVNVLTKEEWARTPGHAYLHLAIGAMKDVEEDVYAYHISLELIQAVRLVRFSRKNPPVLATTWRSTPVLGMVNTRKMPRVVQRSVQARVAQFLSAYSLANPKKGRQPVPPETPSRRTPEAVAPDTAPRRPKPDEQDGED